MGLYDEMVAKADEAETHVCYYTDFDGSKESVVGDEFYSCITEYLYLVEVVNLRKPVGSTYLAHPKDDHAGWGVDMHFGFCCEN